MHILPEPVTQRSSKEQLFRKLPGKSAEQKFLFNKPANCIATVCNFTLNKVFFGLDLLYPLANMSEFRFCFMIEA